MDSEAKHTTSKDDPANKQDAENSYLDNSPGRIVIEVIPDKKIGFDSDSMFKNSPAGAPKTLLD